MTAGMRLVEDERKLLETEEGGCQGSRPDASRDSPSPSGLIRVLRGFSERVGSEKHKMQEAVQQCR